MITIRKLDKTGDTAVAFEQTDAEGMAKAKAMFENWMERKMPAFVTGKGETEDRKVTSFDQIHEGDEVILVPAIVAG